MAFAHRVASIPVAKVEMHINCKNLMNRDVTSKSDPMCVIYMQDNGRWYEFGRTENIKNSLNPQFATTFEVDYYFEEVQQVKFQVFDLDNKTPDLNDDDFLGAIECTLGQIVSGGPYTKPLMIKGKPAKSGSITIRADELSKLNDVLHLSFRAQKLDDKDTFSKSDPYLEFQRQAPDGTWQVVHRTEVIMDNLNPVWKPFKIKVQKLCAGDYNRMVKVDCYDYDSDGSHDFIGTFSTTVNEMIKAQDRKIEFPCINPKKKAKKKNYQNSGIVFLTSCTVSKEYSFLDYIFGGLQINFTVGIDFTASNGNPKTPQSLHYINLYQPNEYQKAIMAVGTVIQDYDSDQLFPALGFGARVPPNFEPSHEFAINFNPSNPFCAGVKGICEAYTTCVSQVQLYGPTNFSPIIHHVARFAQAAVKEEGAQNYYVLLIITDGVISDMNDTLAAIVAASTLPMSIIIIGVGQADFSAMNVLDGDDGVLRTPYGERAKRDIVQFVPFREFEKSPPAELAKHVLAEVPKQVCDYYKMVGIVPRESIHSTPTAPIQ